MTAYDQVKEELKVLERMDHPNVIFLHEVIDDPKGSNIYLVTDFYPNGSIGDKIAKLNSKNADQNEKAIREERPDDV